MDRTAGFPKTARYSFASRIDNLALEIMDNLVLARYSRRPEKDGYLRDADIGAMRMQVLVRLCHSRGLIGRGGYEHMSRRLADFGAMIGGWRNSLGRGPNTGNDE